MFASVNGVKIFYEQEGRGKPFLLLHGNSEDHTKFSGLVPLLARNYTVYALDSRDHGQSGRTDGLSYMAMMEDVAAFIHILGLERPILLGASDGGIVGLLTAIYYPELLSGLIACGANTKPEQLKKWFLAVCKMGYRFTKDAKLKMMLTEPNIEPQHLAGISIPTLILAGSRDIVAGEVTRMIAGSIPGSQVKILKGETHSSYLKHCDRVMDAMASFLDTIK